MKLKIENSNFSITKEFMIDIYFLKWMEIYKNKINTRAKKILQIKINKYKGRKYIKINWEWNYNR